MLPTLSGMCLSFLYTYGYQWSVVSPIWSSRALWLGQRSRPGYQRCHSSRTPEAPSVESILTSGGGSPAHYLTAVTRAAGSPDRQEELPKLCRPLDPLPLLLCRPSLGKPAIFATAAVKAPPSRVVRVLPEDRSRIFKKNISIVDCTSLLNTIGVFRNPPWGGGASLKTAPLSNPGAPSNTPGK